MEGELLARCGRPSDGEPRFRAAIQVSRNRGEKSLELRATMSLARVLVEQDRRDEARRQLAEMYAWFTEGVSRRCLHPRTASEERLTEPPEGAILARAVGDSPGDF
jgi:hypothetical protein